MSDSFPASTITIRGETDLVGQPQQELRVLCCSLVTDKDIFKHFISRGRVALLSLYNGHFLLMGVGRVMVTPRFIAVESLHNDGGLGVVGDTY